MAIQREKIGKQLRRIRATHRKLDVATGMLHNTKRDLLLRQKKVTLIGLFVSDGNTFLIRPHLFQTKTARNAVAWNAWFAEHYGGILRTTILPNMEKRTGKQWRLYRIIGWLRNDHTGLIRAKIHSGRNKSKRARR